MYANFTQETCTGTGDILTLTGADTGNIPFSASFADGDLVAYVVEDSAGTIKVTGVGTYNTGNTITRNDSWNYNGAVVDKNPASNILLSDGDHTIRSDVDQSYVFGEGDWDGRASIKPTGDVGFVSMAESTANFTVVANRVYFLKLYVPNAMYLTKLGSHQIAAASGTKFRVGVYSIKYDPVTQCPLPDILLAESGDIDASTTGFNRYNTLTPAIKLSKGNYLIAFVFDGAPTVQGGNVARGSSQHRLAINSPSASAVTAYILDVASGWSALPNMEGTSFNDLDGTEGFSFPFPASQFRV